MDMFKCDKPYPFLTLSVIFQCNIFLNDYAFWRWVKQEGELAKQQASESAAPKLDLSFKEGQTIKISIGVSVQLQY